MKKKKRMVNNKLLNTSNNVNYSFINTNKTKDQIPEWMDNFFDTYLNQSNNNDNVKVAQLFNTPIKEHHCNCCGNKLQKNEVTFCKQCINNAIN